MMDRVTNEIRSAGAGKPSRLRVLAADGTVREVRVPPVGVLLGADPSADVVIEDGAVSRKHVTVIPTANGFDVKDLGSRNGTWVEGIKITQAVLPPGTSLRLGRCVVVLMPSEDAVELPPSSAPNFGELWGDSPIMRKLFTLLQRASQSDAPVMLLGESGTGKELAARALHEQSKRRAGPFVVFDCGAASETLIEGELFGHKKGAFTGAQADRSGAFANAHGGTLFLDEIGDLPTLLQPKLLRLLERGEVTPLGAKKSETYDVRFVAATHRDLFRETEQGTFRADLFYRLSVIEAHLPPLRSRTEDIPLLVRRFLERFGSSAKDVEGPALARLLSYAFPGNVRELRNVIARAVALAPPNAPFADMPVLLRGAQREESKEVDLDVPFLEAKEAVVQRFEREYLTALLKRTNENLAQAARVAGMDRKHLYRVLERAGCLPERLRGKEEKD